MEISPKKAQNQTLCVWFCAFLRLIWLTKFMNLRTLFMNLGTKFMNLRFLYFFCKISPKKAQNQTHCVWFCAFLRLIGVVLCLVLCFFRTDFFVAAVRKQRARRSFVSGFVPF